MTQINPSFLARNLSQIPESYQTIYLGSSVCVVTRLNGRRIASDTLKGQDICLVQSGFQTHPDVCPVRIAGSFPGGKTVGA